MSQASTDNGQRPHGRVGLIVPSSNSTVEPEFYRALPEEVTVHSHRLKLTRIHPDQIDAMVAELDTACQLLATADVDVLVLGATAPSFLHGLGYDATLIDKMKAASGKAATTTSTAMVAALKHMGVERVGLGSAYTDSVNDIAAGFLEANGFTVTARKGLGMEDNLAVGRLGPETAIDIGMAAGEPEGDAVLLACTNWTSMPAIETLEQRLGKPVMSTSQVSIWMALKTIGWTAPIPGFGQLMRSF